MKKISHCFLCFTLLLCTPLLGQPLADRVPADAIVYAGWRGSDELGPTYKDSHLAAILAQSNFSAVFNDFVPRLLLKAGQKNPDGVKAMQTMQSIGGVVWRHPSAIFFTGVNPAGPRGPIPKFALICNAGADAATLLQSMQTLISKVPEAENGMLHAAQVGDVVMITTGYGENDPVIAGAEQPGAPKGPDPIGPTRTFANALAQVQSDSTSILYIDLEKALALIDEFSGVADPSGREKWMKVRDALGLNGLKRIIATTGFDGKDFASQSFIEAPAPHKGITTLLDVQPVPDEMLKLVPQDASTVFASSVADPAKVIDTIRTAAAEIDPRVKQGVDQGLGVVSMFVGKNLQTEILAPLGKSWVIYNSPSVAGRGITGYVLVNKPEDPKKAEQGINALAIAICNAINSQTNSRDVSIALRQTKIGDLNISYIGIPIVTPAWAVKDGNLYVALYPQNVAAAARAAASSQNGKSILDNPEFVAMRKRLNVEKPASLSYIDMRPTAADTYQMLIALARAGLGMADLTGVRAPEPVLPPLDVVLENLAPAGSAGFVDEAGWHSRTISPFPGAEVLAGQPGIAAPALLASLALPAVAKARQQAADVGSISNLRQIALSCQMYANDHDGKLPPDLGTLAADGLVSNLHVFIKPQPRTPLPLPKFTKEQQKDWINKNSDYIYVGGGKALKDIANTSQTILAYERPALSANNRRAVAFVDGHCEIMPEQDLQQRLAVDGARP